MSNYKRDSANTQKRSCMEDLFSVLCETRVKFLKISIDGFAYQIFWCNWRLCNICV